MLKKLLQPLMNQKCQPRYIQQLPERWDVGCWSLWSSSCKFPNLAAAWLRVLERFELLNYIRSTVLMTRREYLVSTKALPSFAINK